MSDENQPDRIEDETPPQTSAKSQEPQRYNNYILTVRDEIETNPLPEFNQIQSNFGHLLKSMNWDPETKNVHVHLKDSKTTSYWMKYFPYVQKYAVSLVNPIQEAQEKGLRCLTGKDLLVESPETPFRSTVSQQAPAKMSPHQQVLRYIVGGWTVEQIFQHFENEQNGEVLEYILDHLNELNTTVTNRASLHAKSSSKSTDPISNLALSMSMTQPFPKTVQSRNVNSEPFLFGNPSTREPAHPQGRQDPPLDEINILYHSLNKVIMSQSTDPRLQSTLKMTRELLEEQTHGANLQETAHIKRGTDASRFVQPKPKSRVSSVRGEEIEAEDKLTENQLRNSGKKKVGHGTASRRSLTPTNSEEELEEDEEDDEKKGGKGRSRKEERIKRKEAGNTTAKHGRKSSRDFDEEGQGPPAANLRPRSRKDYKD
jgi:hypothetical protein